MALLNSSVLSEIDPGDGVKKCNPVEQASRLLCTATVSTAFDPGGRVKKCTPVEQASRLLCTAASQRPLTPEGSRKLAGGLRRIRRYPRLLTRDRLRPWRGRGWVSTEPTDILPIAFCVP